ncbi:hypothetical protein JZ785_17230 [Alicyclobacillus curvatus]|nr:hypothetical protein JZ785_17230 [Alicyclobacillus curvatus]
MLFHVGKVHISKNVLQSSITAQDLVSAFAQYINGDWGEISSKEEIENDAAIAFGDRIIGRYVSMEGHEFCITTHDGMTQIMTRSEVVTLTRTS